jgi:hypothetical protein
MRFTKSLPDLLEGIFESQCWRIASKPFEGKTPSKE